MIFYVLIGAVFALALIKYFRTKFLFRLVEFAIICTTVSVLCFSVIFSFSGFGFFESMFISSFIALVFAIAKFNYSKLKNTAAILSSAGVGAIFGYSIGIWPTLLFIVAISLYDYIAVFKTRHMLELADGLATNELSFTLSATSEKQTKHSEHKSYEHDSSAHENYETSRLDLGSGDLAVPAILAVSAYSATGLIGSVAIALGSIISIFITLKFVVDKKIVLPALPPICLGGLLFLLISQLIILFVAD
jgi:presenilin-like A22 family membrane protease